MERKESGEVLQRGNLKTPLEHYLTGSTPFIGGEIVNVGLILGDTSKRSFLLTPEALLTREASKEKIIRERTNFSDYVFRGILPFLDPSYIDYLEPGLSTYMKPAKVDRETGMTNDIWEVGLMDKKGNSTTKNLDKLKINESLTEFFTLEKANDGNSLILKLK